MYRHLQCYFKRNLLKHGVFSSKTVCKTTQTQNYSKRHQDLVNTLIEKRYFTSEPPTQLPKRKKSWARGIGTMTWRNVAITLGFGGLFLVGMLYMKKQKELAIQKERKRVLGKASIGGSFDLVDHDGKPCSSKDFHGRWLLLYFGFTHCPDVCPDEMEKMINVVEILDKIPDVPKVQPLFITVDPDRDNIQAVKAYVQEFSPKLIGLTGSKEQIEKATKAYRVYFSAGPEDKDNDYIVDHTIITYLINPEGEFVDYYGQNVNANQVADHVQIQMVRYEQLNSSSWF